MHYIVLLLLVAVASGNAIQNVVKISLIPGQPYLIQNINFPHLSGPNVVQRWNFESESPIHIACTFELNNSARCADMSFVMVDEQGELKTCLWDRFEATTEGNSLFVEFYTASYSSGGRFQCEIQTTQKKCTHKELFIDFLKGSKRCINPHKFFYWKTL